VKERSAVSHAYQLRRGEIPTVADSIILSCETERLVALRVNLVSEMSQLDDLGIFDFWSLLISEEIGVSN
jgi:hypothetical protein